MTRTLGFTRTFLRISALTTVVCMLPTSVQAWNLMPEPSTAEALEAPPTLSEARLAELSGSHDALRESATLSDTSLERLRALDVVAAKEPDQEFLLAKAATTQTETADSLYHALQEDDAGLLSEAGDPRILLPAVDANALVEQAHQAKTDLEQRRVEIARVIKRKERIPTTTRFIRGAPSPAAKSEPNPAISFTQALSEALELNLSNMTPEAQLAAADGYLTQGEVAEAGLLYFHIEDTAPGSEAARFATATISDLGRKAEKGEVQAAELAEFMDNLPLSSQCASLHGKYWLSLAYRVAGVAARESGAEEDAAEHFGRSMQTAEQLILSAPTDPLQVLIVRAYLTAARNAGAEETAAAKAYLQGVLRREETYDVARFAALSELGFHLFTYESDRPESMFMWLNMVDEFEHGHYDVPLSVESADPAVDAHVHFAYGHALFQLNRRADALEVFNNCIQIIPNGGSGTDLCRYYAALTQYFIASDPFVGVQAFEAALAAKPNSTVADTMLFMLGRIYMEAKNYQAAREVFQELKELEPDGRFFDTADKAIAQAIAEEELEAAREAFNEGEGGVAKNQNLCGPYAVAVMLEAGGHPIAWADLVSTLGVQVGQQFSIEALAALSAGFGMPMEGAEISQLDEVPLPFIAHLEPNHFVVVEDVQTDRVSVREIGEPLTVLAREQFDARFSGAGLVRVAHEDFARLLTADEQRGILGGSGGLGDGTDDFSGVGLGEMRNTGDCMNAAACSACKPCCPSPQNQSYASQPQSNKCNKSSETSGPPGSQDASTGAFSTNPDPRIRILGASGASGILDARQASQTFAESDLSVAVRGANHLNFARQWTNPFGYQRGYYASADRPFRASLGKGWVHSYNIHLRISTNEGYVLMVDGNGNHFQYVETAANSRVYRKSSALMAYELREAQISKNTSTGVYTYTNPGDATYTFAAMVDSGGDRYSRIEAIEDADANVIDLQYNNSVHSPYGLLTKIAAPSGDNRHIKLHYDGSDEYITKASFMDNTTEVKYVQYFQDGWTKELTKVRVNGNTGNEVEYTYANATYGSLTGTYVSKVTDRAGVETNFRFDYAYSSSLTYFQPTKMRIVYDNDLEVVAKKTGWPTNYTKAQISTQSSADYDIPTDTYANDPYTIWEFDVDSATDYIGVSYYKYFPDPSNLANSFQFDYEYDADGQLTTIEYGALDWENRSYTANGRLDQVHHFGTLVADYHYASSTDFRPDYVQGADGIKTYYWYDADGRVTREAHPSYTASDPPSSGQGRFYTYTSNNQISTVTEPDGRVFTYKYDSLGNMTKLILPDDNVTTPTHAIEYLYDEYGMVTQAKDARGKYTYYTYADEGCGGCGGSVGRKLVEIEDDDGHITQFEYDVNGNQTKVIDALTRETTYFYDSMNRLTKVEDPDGNATTMEYHLLGRLTKQTDPSGRVTNTAMTIWVVWQPSPTRTCSPATTSP